MNFGHCLALALFTVAAWLTLMTDVSTLLVQATWAAGGGALLSSITPWQRVRNWLIVKLGGVTPQEWKASMDRTWRVGYDDGLAQAKTHFKLLPMPFTDDQLAGREYGMFITPAGFASSFGESTIPAPGQHGYEMRAYYVHKDDLRDGDATGVLCRHPRVFANPSDSEYLVPVLLTVLR